MMYQQPQGPWFVNVRHWRVQGRPYCQSPVDYSVVEMSDTLINSNCAACFKEASLMTSKEVSHDNR